MNFPFACTDLLARIYRLQIAALIVYKIRRPKILRNWKNFENVFRYRIIRFINCLRIIFHTFMKIVGDTLIFLNGFVHFSGPNSRVVWNIERDFHIHNYCVSPASASACSLGRSDKMWCVAGKPCLGWIQVKIRFSEFLIENLTLNSSVGLPSS